MREKYFGFELQGNFGVSTGSVDTVSLKLNSEASIYAVGFLPMSPKADLFARVGYGHVNVDVSGAGGSASASDDGVRLDYTHFFDTQESSVNFDEVSVSYVRRF